MADANDRRKDQTEETNQTDRAIMALLSDMTQLDETVKRLEIQTIALAKNRGVAIVTE